MTYAPVWQHPYVDVFKLCQVDTWSGVRKEGEVEAQLDKVIGKRVIKLTGSVPAANYVQVPKLKSQSLGLTGRFLYIQVKMSTTHHFVIHIDATTADGNTHRVSISTLYKRGKKVSNGVQMSFDGVTGKWCVLAIDMWAAVAEFTTSEYACLRSLQLCSWLTVRSIYTSDTKYSLQNLPRDMLMSAALNPHDFEMRWMPKEPQNVPEPETRKPSAAALKEIYRTFGRGAHSAGASVASGTADATPQPDNSPRNSPRNVAGNVRLPAEEHAAQLDGAILEPDPIMRLERIQGYTGEFTRTLLWAPCSEELVFTSASAVVAMSADGKTQRFFFGHTSYVCALAFDGAGLLLATAQEGKQANIRVWEFQTGQCLAVLTGHASNIAAIDISQDGRALLGVGQDAQSRQAICLWDISELRTNGKAQLLVRQSTDYNIKCARFSTFEDDRFMTCGRDNVRMWRLKNGKLNGLSIRLGSPDMRVQVAAEPGSAAAAAALVGPTVFTDIAYETAGGAMPLEQRLVFVASASGSVFQINYTKRTLEAVYQLHLAAINSIVMHDGFCVTGSDDKFLRVWPLDFSDHLMEAEHEGPVTSVGISPEGLRVAIGSEYGAIGMLDISTHQYATLLRSHCGAVNAVAADPLRPEYCTASSDGTIRIWDRNTHQQLYEFDAPGEVVMCCCYHPLQHELTCGFDNGRVRIFDVGTTTLVQEHRQHKAVVLDLAYTPGGERMFSAGADGTVCVYDVVQLYNPIKVLSSGATGNQVCMAVSPNGQFLATVAYSPQERTTSLLIFHTSTLEPYMRIETDIPAFVKLAFSPTSPDLWVLTSDQELQRYDLLTGQLLQLSAGAHREAATALVVEPAGRFLSTAGADKMLKMWGCMPREQLQGNPAPPKQNFVGHPASVSGMCFMGSHVASVGQGEAIYLWRLNPAVATGPGREPMAAEGGVSLTLRTGLDQMDDAAHLDTLPEEPEGLDQERPSTADGQDDLEEQSPSSTGRGRPTSAPSQVTQRSTPTRKTRRKARPGTAAEGQHQAAATHVMPQLACSMAVGFNCQLPFNMVWRHDTGLFAYAIDNVVVLEDLETRQQQYLIHHTQPVGCIAASHDSRWLASASSAPEPSGTAEIVIWEASTARRHHVLAFHPLCPQQLLFSDDGSWLCSIGRDPERAVVLWSTSSGETVAVGRTLGPLAAAAWLRGRALPEFVTVGQDGPLLWSLQPTCLEQRQLSIPGAATVPCTAVWCGDDGEVVFANQRGAVWRMQLSASGSPEAGHQVAVLPGGQQCCAMALGDRHAVIASTSGLITYFRRLADAEGAVWELLGSVELDGLPTALSLEPSCTEGMVATGSGTVWYVDMAEGTRVPLLCAHATEVTALHAAAHDPRILASGCTDGVLRIWQLGQHEAEPLVEFQAQGAAQLACVAVAPSGQEAVAGYADGMLRCFKLRQAGQAWAAARHAAPVVAAICHPQQQLVMTASRDGVIAVTHMGTSRLVAVCSDLSSRGGPLEALALSPGEASMAAAAWATHLEVFPAPWKDVHARIVGKYKCPEGAPSLPSAVPAQVCFAPAATRIVLYTSPNIMGRVVLFDYRTASVVRTIELPQMLYSLAASPDGSHLAVGGGRGSVFLLQYEGGSCVEFAGHLQPVTKLQFSSDSRRLASTAGSTMLLWQAKP